MTTAKECVCCNGIPEIDEKRKACNVNCITEHSGFIANCLNTDVLETSYYEHKETHGPPQENEMIHE